ncbi:hypothetical protein EDD21DRAFT_363389 [Dissophora ornata]|nr:hypothetical protein EDD21DRAFT_363389 [Dissophora ornata]
MKAGIFLATVFLALGANAATLQNCQVDKDFDVLPGSHGSDTVTEGSTYCFDLIGTVFEPFPKGSLASVSFRNLTRDLWTVQAPLCKVLRSGPSKANCPGLAKNNKGLTGCIKIPKAKIALPKSGTTIQVSIEVLTEQGALTCIKGTLKIA